MAYDRNKETMLFQAGSITGAAGNDIAALSKRITCKPQKTACAILKAYRGKTKSKY